MIGAGGWKFHWRMEDTGEASQPTARDYWMAPALRGHPVPPNLPRSDGGSPHGSKVQGDWNGAIAIPARTINLALHVSGSGSHLTVALDRQAQGAMALPRSNVVLSGNDFGFQFHLCTAAITERDCRWQKP